MRVFERDRPKEPVMQIVERLPEALSADIQVQRVTNKALLALASCGQIGSATEDAPGVLVVSSRLVVPMDSSGRSADAESPWSLNVSASGSANLDRGAETLALGNVSLGLLRSTGAWLLAAHSSGFFSYQKITFNGVSEELTDYDVTLSAIAARTLREHWSIGITPLVRHSPNVKNFRLNANLLAGVEFNLVPFKLGTNNGNIIAEYSLGPEFSLYRTANLSGESRALYAVHSLSVSAEWHFALMDPAVTLGAVQDLTRPAVSMVSLIGDFLFRIGSRVAIGPHIGFRYQTAARNQPMEARGGTLQAAQDAQAFSSQAFAVGLTVSVNFGNANLANLDNRWKLTR